MRRRVCIIALTLIVQLFKTRLQTRVLQVTPRRRRLAAENIIRR